MIEFCSQRRTSPPDISNMPKSLLEQRDMSCHVAFISIAAEWGFPPAGQLQAGACETRDSLVLNLGMATLHNTY